MSIIILLRDCTDVCLLPFRHAAPIASFKVNYILLESCITSLFALVRTIIHISSSFGTHGSPQCEGGGVGSVCVYLISII